MKTQPYEKGSIRSKRAWEESAAIVGVHPVILRDVYIDRWCHAVQARNFLDCIKRNNEKGFLETVKAECAEAAKDWTDERIAEKEAQSQEFAEERDFSDLMDYRLKQLIEVGDEIRAEETKTFLSGGEYLTKGKLYKIVELRDDGLCDFTAITRTNFEAEPNWSSIHGVRSLWRDGVEIWNWHQAYFDLWCEQNPDHPQTEDMRTYAAEQIEKATTGDTAR